MVDGKRSYIMSCIRGKDTKPELALDKALRESGVLGYERNYKNIVGKPDFVWLDRGLVVFLDGCFWHGCPEHFRLPKTNVDFWRGKIERNRRRDINVEKELIADGWKVLRIWEHEIKNDLDVQINRIRHCLDNLT